MLMEKKGLSRRKKIVIESFKSFEPESCAHLMVRQTFKIFLFILTALPYSFKIVVVVCRAREVGCRCWKKIYYCNIYVLLFFFLFNRWWVQRVWGRLLRLLSWMRTTWQIVSKNTTRYEYIHNFCFVHFLRCIIIDWYYNLVIQIFVLNVSLCVYLSMGMAVLLYKNTLYRSTFNFLCYVSLLCDYRCVLSHD